MTSSMMNYGANLVSVLEYVNFEKNDEGPQ